MTRVLISLWPGIYHLCATLTGNLSSVWYLIWISNWAYIPRVLVPLWPGIYHPCGIWFEYHTGNKSPVCWYHSGREYVTRVVFDFNIKRGIYPPCTGTTSAGNISPVYWYYSGREYITRVVFYLNIKRELYHPCGTWFEYQTRNISPCGIWFAYRTGNISRVCWYHSGRKYITRVVFDLNIQRGIYHRAELNCVR